MPLRNIYIIAIALLVAILCHTTARQHHSARVVGQAVDLVNRYYVDPVDDRELLENAMSGMLQSLDQHTQYIPPDAYERFESLLQQEFAGIGILVEQPNPDEPVRVITPLFGSPALKAGLMPGDEIVAVDGIDVSTMSLKEVSDRLRGPVNEEVLVGLQRDGEPLTISVRRGQIALESVIGDHRDPDSGWVFRIREHPRIAYIRITSFGEKTVSEVRGALGRLDNDFDALVLDLRGNAGGLLNAAASICDMFLDEGVIVTTQGRGGKLLSEAKATNGTLVDSDKPIAVLINGESASASEIVAACLQDHKRAVIVGTRSFGKGTVQNVLMMEYGRSALKLTTARYYRPSGRNIHRKPEADEDDEWGVLPDPGLEAELTEEEKKRLVRRWQRATFPVMDSPKREQDNALASPSEEDLSVEPDSPEGLDSDPQLQRAIEFLQTSR